MKKRIDGVMSESGHERYLSVEEYQFWLWHPLPYGWAIIAKPLGWKEGE